MSRGAVYNDLRIAASHRKQMVAFTAETSRRVYQGQQRRNLARHGYPDRTITVRHPDVLRWITDNAEKNAGMIQRGYNRALKSALSGQPDGLTDAERKGALGPFMDAVRAHNTDKVNTRIYNEVTTRATQDFYGKNDFDAKVALDPDYSDSPPGEYCQELLEQIASAGGSVDASDAAEWEIPNHPQCFHTVRLVSLGHLPSADSLDLGEGDGEAE